MGGSLKFGLQVVPFLAAAVVVAGCGSMPASQDSSGEGYKALSAGDYAKARDVFATMHAKDPHDPFAELNLAVSQQNLGRMDLAEPLYRGVLVDGKGVVPGVTTRATDTGKTLSDIACTNLRLGTKNPNAC
jgi:hypothetical protein